MLARSPKACIKGAAVMPELSHHESHVLALICKWQPATAYFIRKTLERGLASTFSGSPGSVYPIIERLKRHDLVRGVPVAADGRRAQQLECTEQGVEAVRAWIVRIDADDVLPEDPWRTRMTFLDLLSTQQRLAWLLSIRDAAQAQDEILRALVRPDEAGATAAIEGARMLNDARLGWIERLIAGEAARR